MLNFVCLQEIQSFTHVPLVITVMVCLAVTLMGGQGPDSVLCTHIGPFLERAVRVTACLALLVHTVTAQVPLYSNLVHYSICEKVIYYSIH